MFGIQFLGSYDSQSSWIRTAMEGYAATRRSTRIRIEATMRLRVYVIF